MGVPGNLLNIFLLHNSSLQICLKPKVAQCQSRHTYCINPVTSDSPIVCRTVMSAIPVHLGFILAPVRNVNVMDMLAAVTQRLEIVLWVTPFHYSCFGFCVMEVFVPCCRGLIQQCESVQASCVPGWFVLDLLHHFVYFILGLPAQHCWA